MVTLITRERTHKKTRKYVSMYSWKVINVDCID